MIVLRRIDIKEDVYRYNYLDIKAQLICSCEWEFSKLYDMIKEKFNYTICENYGFRLIGVRFWGSELHQNILELHQNIFQEAKEILENKTLALMYTNHENQFLSLLSEISLKIN